MIAEQITMTVDEAVEAVRVASLAVVEARRVEADAIRAEAAARAATAVCEEALHRARFHLQRAAIGIDLWQELDHSWARR